MRDTGPMFTDEAVRRAQEQGEVGLNTDIGMALHLDEVWGVGRWIYDPAEDIWLTPDADPDAPSGSWIVAFRGGRFFRVRLLGWRQ